MHLQIDDKQLVMLFIVAAERGDIELAQTSLNKTRNRQMRSKMLNYQDSQHQFQ